MNFKALIAELVAIQNNPRPQSVTVTETSNRRFTNYVFKDAYYYPAGIRGITIERGGAGVVYVYTTDQRSPHLTIPDDGQNLHWTTTTGRDGLYANWPQPIQRFVALFP